MTNNLTELMCEKENSLPAGGNSSPEPEKVPSEDGGRNSAQELTQTVLNGENRDKEPTRETPCADTGGEKPEDDWARILNQTNSKWNVLQYPLVLPILLCLMGFVGFYFYVQTVSLITSLRDMPIVIQIPLFGILVLFLSLVICGLWDFWKTFRKLRRNAQVVWKKLDDIQNVRVYAAARKHLRQYLKDYPLPRRGKKSELTQYFDQDVLDKLTETKNQLTQNNNHSAEALKECFTKHFQDYLDKAAKDRIYNVALLSGMKTAISPYAVLDMMITVFWSFRLMRDLCLIYNVRTGFVGTAYLLCCVFGMTFFSGKINEWESDMGKQITEMFGNRTSFFDLLPNAVQGVGKTLTAIFIGKAAEGAANCLLMRQFGYRAMQMLKPLR